MLHSSASEYSKSALRKEALSLRSQLPIEVISRAIRQNLQAFPGFVQAKHVLFYASFRNEVDLLPLAPTFPEKNWYLPAVAEQGDLVFYPYQANTTLEPGKYGIATPPRVGNPFTPSSDPALILVPGVMFDRQGYRLGYGKGYYDRFFSRFKTDPETFIRLGIVPEVLWVEALPNDPWDIPMHGIVTEQSVHSIT